MAQGRYGSVSYKTKQNRPQPKEAWYRVEGTHEAIIDRDLWDRVQSLSASQAKPFRGGTIGLFARKVLCASCGYTMRSTKSRGKHYLQCASRRAARDACPGAFISVDALEWLVIQELNSLSRHYLDQEELVRCVVCVQSVHQQRQNWLKTKETLRQRLDDNRLCLRCLYLDKVKGIVSEADYRSMADSFSAERERMEHLFAEAGRHLEELEDGTHSEEQQWERILRDAHVEHLTRKMVEHFIDCIIVGKRLPGTRSVPVEIHWNF